MKPENQIKRAVVLLSPLSNSYKLWGMTLAERILRQLSAVGVRQTVLICQAACERESILRKDFDDWSDMALDFRHMGSAEENMLLKTLRESEGRSIVLDANIVLDQRVLQTLVQSDKALSFKANNRTISALTASEYISNGNEYISINQLDEYLPVTRKKVAPYIIPIDKPSDIDEAEKVTFSAVYKGATDFITKFVLFLPTRWFVRFISPSNITPNQITLVGMLLSFGAIIPFFLGLYELAVIMGFTMAFLDTVDGKLARTTLRTSKTGEWLDHISDTVYLLLWYLGLGYSLSEGQILDLAHPVSQAHAVLITAFVLDKSITGLYKRIYGFEIHDYTRLDYIVRIFIARRNPFLVCMTVALVLKQPALGLYLITIWYLLTFGFHLLRFVYLPLSGKQHQVTKG